MGSGRRVVDKLDNKDIYGALADLKMKSWLADLGATTPSPVCHLVRQRIETRHGRPIYRTRQVCR
jgi:hypothetical protein